MVFIILDGENKSGKSTLIKEFHKASNYKYSAIDRFSLTSFSFGKANDRILNYKDYLCQDLNIWNDAILFFTEVPKNILRQRFKEHDELDIDLEKDYDKMKKIYNTYLSLTPLFVKKINTKNSITDCVNEMKKTLIEFENETIQHKVYRLIRFIEKNGEIIKTKIPNSNSKEVKNVVLKYESRNLSCIKLWRNNKDYLEERPEYDQIKSYLDNTIRLKLNYFKTQDLSSRQFIYHDYSCISSVQILYRNNILYMNVFIRSSNVKDTLLFDIRGLNDIAKYLNNKYFNAENIKFNLSISSAHVLC